MAVLKPRKRLVYFRVSEEEFQRFSIMCDSTEARSLSDLARTALERMMHDGNAGAEVKLTQKLALLDDLIQKLQSKLYQLDHLVEQANGQAISRKASRKLVQT